MFKYATPEEVGIASEKVLDFIRTLDGYKFKTHSLIMARGDKIFAEAYYKPFHKDSLHRMYSVSKSFIAMAVGIAEQEGLVGLNDRIMKYFPEYNPPNTDANFCDVTIRDMLTMQTSVATNPDWWGKTDRVESYFCEEARQIPGTSFTYDSTGAFVLCSLIEKVTGENFLEYLKRKVLLDMGFSKESYCLVAPGGHSHGDSGVMCTARDVLIFARFLMNKGEYNGKQYISRDFVETAISKQTETDDMGIHGSFNDYGYGYLIWKMPRDGFALVGMADQYAICDPETDFVFVITSENMDYSASRPIIFHECYKTLIANLDKPFSLDIKKLDELRCYLDSRELTSLEGATESTISNAVSGRCYKLCENPMKIDHIRVTFDGKSGVLEYKNYDGINKIKFGMGYNVFSKFPGRKRLSKVASVYENGVYECAASAVWREDKKLHIMVQIIDTFLGTLDIAIGFKDDRLTLRMHKHAQRILDNYNGYATGEAQL